MSINKKENIFNIVKQHICEVIPELENYSVKLSDSFAELGANSVDRAELATMSMETLSLQIPRVELAGIKNIGDLVEILTAKID